MVLTLVLLLLLLLWLLLMLLFLLLPLVLWLLLLVGGVGVPARPVLSDHHCRLACHLLPACLPPAW